MGIFVTPPKSDVQKGATAYMKESSKSKTYILLLSEIGWGAVFKKLRLYYSISYRNVQARGHFISDPNDPGVPPLISSCGERKS